MAYRGSGAPAADLMWAFVCGKGGYPSFLCRVPVGGVGYGSGEDAV